MVLVCSLIAAAMFAPGVVGLVMMLVKQGEGDERASWGWAALAMPSLATAFTCLLFTASIEQLAPLIVGCLVFWLWGLVALFARFYVYR